MIQIRMTFTPTGFSDDSGNYPDQKPDNLSESGIRCQIRKRIQLSDSCENPLRVKLILI